MLALRSFEEPGASKNCTALRKICIANVNGTRLDSSQPRSPHEPSFPPGFFYLGKFFQISLGNFRRRMMRMKILSIFAVIAAAMLLLTAQISPAASATWTGSGNQHWSNPAAWTLGGPPNGPGDVHDLWQRQDVHDPVSTNPDSNSYSYTKTDRYSDRHCNSHNDRDGDAPAASPSPP
jgi:hypothetical protein